MSPAEPSILLLRVRKLARALRHRRYRAALRKGILPATDHSDAGLGAHFATVFDVGASRGQFAVFARHTWPEANLVCFEPLAENAQRIREIVSGPIEVHPVAVGAEPATQTLHVSSRDDASSLLPIGRHAVEFPGTTETGVRSVPVDTLANHLDATTARPVLVKIDVQGCELDVLRGAGDGLDHVDEIVCECSYLELYTGQALAGAVIAFLEARGFALVHVSGTCVARDGRQLQADFTFRRR